MANLDWIKRIVNTAQRPCPIRLAEKCPGERSGCAFWISEPIESGAQHDVVEGCLIAFQYVIGHEAVLESVRTQAAIQQSDNHPVLRGLAMALKTKAELEST